jgi:hypothetical protein
MCVYCDNSQPGNQYFMALSRCYKCLNSSTIIVLLVILYAGFIILNAGVTRSIEVFHVLVNFCQLLSVINGFNTNWPNSISNLFNFATILAFETDVLQPQCLYPDWDYSHNLIAQLLMPAGMFLLVFIWIGVVYLMYRARMAYMGKEEEEVDFSRSSNTSMQSMHSMSFAEPKASVPESRTSSFNPNKMKRSTTMSSIGGVLNSSSTMIFLQVTCGFEG